MLVAYPPNRAQLPGAILLGDAPRFDLNFFAIRVGAVVSGGGFAGQRQVQRLLAQPLSVVRDRVVGAAGGAA